METLFELASRQVNIEEVHPIVQEQLPKYPMVVLTEQYYKMFIERIGPKKYKVTKIECEHHPEVQYVAHMTRWALERLLYIELQDALEMRLTLGLYRPEDVDMNTYTVRHTDGIRTILTDSEVYFSLFPQKTMSWAEENSEYSVDELPGHLKWPLLKKRAEIAVPMVLDLVQMIDEVEYE